MSAPITTTLALKYRWQTPVLVATMSMLFCLAVLVRNRPSGAGSAALVVIALWLVFIAVIWRRTRARMSVADDVLRVRLFRRVHEIRGSQVLGVREYPSPSGASYRLTVRDPGGGQRRYAVPAAMMRHGHSTLFTWILAWAPSAELDRGSRRTLTDLQERGLVRGTPGSARPEQERAPRG